MHSNARFGLVGLAAIVVGGCTASSDTTQTDIGALLGGIADSGDAAVAQIVLTRPGVAAVTCSATLVGPNVLVTAARCAVSAIDPTQLGTAGPRAVRAGATFLAHFGGSTGDVAIAQVDLAPGYNTKFPGRAQAH